VWVPLVPQKAELARTLRVFRVVGRLGAGASVEGAGAEIKAMMGDLAREYIEDQGTSAHAVSLRGVLVGDARPALGALFGAALAVLAVACINVANMQLAEVASRRNEVSIRAAIGAARRALVHQLLVEHITLGLAGAALGALVAAAGVPALVALSAGDLPR